MREWIDEIAEAFGEEVLLFTDFDDALIGISTDYVAVYSERRIIELLVAEGMSEEDAWDHYGFNMLGSHVGQKTPIIVKEPE